MRCRIAVRVQSADDVPGDGQYVTTPGGLSR
jgi:hypothetical protein